MLRNIVIATILMAAVFAVSAGKIKSKCPINNVNRVLADNAVNFTLYFESLCPGCKNFITTQLWTAFQTIPSIMNLTVVPYGNAKETLNNKTGLYEYTCQHGADECWGNLFESCLIYYYPKIEDHFPVIHCIETDSSSIKISARKCAKQFNVTINFVEKCMTSKLGNSLQHQNALLTEALNPPHKYVPWVTLNDQHTEDIENKALNDLVTLICDTYQGSSKPDACNKKDATHK